MATTTNYGWTTPDDTALVKDGASAIRSLGTSVDTTVKNLNPETTLGDISYRSSTANTKTRLAIGTTGQVLTVSGGVPAWATPAGGKSWTLLNAGGTALTGAGTITISGISGKEDLLVLIVDSSSASASSAIGVRPNGISTNYASGYLVINPAGTYSAGIALNTASTAFTSIKIGDMAGAAASQVSGYAWISGCSGTGNKNFTSAGSGTASTSNQHYAYSGGGIVTASAAITSIDIISSVGNFDNGTVYVYGA
jgi:hypothetical protein